MNIKELSCRDFNKEDFVFIKLKEEYCNQPLLFDGFVWGICRKGLVKFKINGQEYILQSQEVFVILPKHIFTLIEYSSNVDLKLILASSDYLHSIPIAPDFDVLKNVWNHPCVKLQDEDMKDMIEICRMLGHRSITNEYSKNIRTILFLSLIFMIASFFQENTNKENVQLLLSHQEKLVYRFFDLVLQYYKTERNVSFYANKLCVTSKYLSTNVKTVTGYPVQSWIFEIIIAEAKHLLCTTGYSILQISEELNFLTVSSFVRFFKTQTGYSPLKYRKR